eukprot:5179869-Amphidinium_carterae.1
MPSASRGCPAQCAGASQDRGHFGGVQIVTRGGFSYYFVSLMKRKREVSCMTKHENMNSICLCKQ